MAAEFEDVHGIRTMGLLTDPDSDMGLWPEMIGKFILNFGAIEWLSYMYLIELDPTRESFDKGLERLLIPRIKTLHSLLDRSTSLGTTTKQELRALWDEAKELAKWRNRIAHNPVIPRWKRGSDSDRSPPDMMGVPDVRQLQDGHGISDTLTIAAMHTLIDVAHSLGERLFHALDKAKARV